MGPPLGPIGLRPDGTQGPGPPSGPLFSVFCFPLPPTTPDPQGRPLPGRSKTLGPAHTPAGVCNACAALRKCFDLPGLPASNEMAERSRDGTRGKNVGSVDVQRAGRTPQSAVCLPYVHGNALEPILFVFHYQKREHADLKLLRNFPNEMNKCQIFIFRRSRRRACDERQGRQPWRAHCRFLP